MQKIIIKNFGPIRDAEIEIRPFTVLLGEQATGKSTVAQLVHFFNSLANDWFRSLLNSTNNLKKEQVKEHLLETIDSKFHDYYGTHTIYENQEIKFYFDIENDKYIQIYSDGHPKALFSNACKVDVDIFCKSVAALSPEKDYDLRGYRSKLRKLTSTFLLGKDEKPFSESVFFIAGRNITVSFPETFKTYFIENYRPQDESEFIGLNIHAGYVHTELTSDFIHHSSRLKDLISEQGEGFNALFQKQKVDLHFQKAFEQRTENILKGQYSLSEGYETIVVPIKELRIALNKSSSGQQESIRILQDLAVQCAFNDHSYRIIEEPEVHLFPSAQNALTELFVMTHNRSGSHFFLTTHSPYFLSSFNNLLYAAKAAGDNFSKEETLNPEHIKRVEELGYPKHLRLLARDFAAYQLKDGTAESIYDPAHAITKIDGLDAVSLELGDKFESLVEIVREAEEYEAA